MTVAELLAARADDTHTGLRAGDDRWTWAEVVRAGAQRAALFGTLRRPGPPHIGVLLENVPEFLFWIGAAALGGAVIAGINPTRRGEALGEDIRHTDCQLLITDRAGLALLDGVDTGLDADRILVIDDPSYPALVAPYAGAALPDPLPGSRDLLLLLFTSGTTGSPKAVRCTQGRLAGIGDKVRELYTLVADDTCYCVMPLFHGNALMALWSGAVTAGSCVALPTTGKFSASQFIDDVRTYGATYFTYVGKALTYILATPERLDDGINTLTRGFGNEASEIDVQRFERRFGCRIIESYGSSEGGVSISRVPDMPEGALGVGPPTLIVADSATGNECPRARFDDGGRLLNGGEAIGEIVNTGATNFEGYYSNEAADAERIRDGWYWTGDLGYRDEAGFFYFAGRGADWLRVDGENFAAAPIERVLARFPGVAMAAVYAIPDASAGDQVMATLVLEPGAVFDPTALERFLGEQADLGTKWAPRFVRVADTMPLTASGKVQKLPLRADAWAGAEDPVWWRPDPRGSAYRLFSAADEDIWRSEFVAHGRAALLPGPPASEGDPGEPEVCLCAICGAPNGAAKCPECGRAARPDLPTFEVSSDDPEYDFADVSALERADAADVLALSGVLYRWDPGFQLRISADREEEVDQLFGHGAPHPETVRAFRTLLEAATLLRADPDDEAGIALLGDATGVVITGDPPPNVNRVLWATVGYLSRQLLDILDTGAEFDDLVAAADVLRAVLVDHVR